MDGAGLDRAPFNNTRRSSLMPDPEDVSPDEEEVDDSTEEPEAPPEVKPVTKPEVKEQAAEPEVKAVDPSSIPLEELLKREDVRKVIQSEKDKEIAKGRRTVEDKRRKEATAEQAREKDARKRRLIEERDSEGLLDLEAKELSDTDELERAVKTVSSTIEAVVKEHPDFAGLGHDRIEEVYDDIRRGGGNVLDFTLRLAEERRKADVAKATREATATIPDLVAREVEARLVEAGVVKRTDATNKGDAPVEKVSGGGVPKLIQGDKTWEEATDEYNSGDMPWEEYAPYHIEHEKQLRR